MISTVTFYGGSVDQHSVQVNWDEAPEQYRMPRDLGPKLNLITMKTVPQMREVYVLRGVYDGEAEYGYSHDEVVE